MKAGRLSPGSSMILWFVVAIILTALFQLRGELMPFFHWPSALIASIPLLAVFLGIYLVFRSYQKSMSPNDNGFVLGEKTIEFSDAGIKESGTYGYSFFLWDVVEDVVENQDDLYIFIDKLYAVIIPGDSFPSKSEKEGLKQAIEERLGIEPLKEQSW